MAKRFDKPGVKLPPPNPPASAIFPDPMDAVHHDEQVDQLVQPESSADAQARAKALRQAEMKQCWDIINPILKQFNVRLVGTVVIMGNQIIKNDVVLVDNSGVGNV